MDIISLLRILAVIIVSLISLITILFLLVSLIEFRSALKSDPKPKRYPSVTVIIPAYNEERTLEKTVRSVLKLKYPGKLKIIIVDDGSTDKTPEIADRLAKESDKIEVIHKKNGGKASALNVGLERVDTELFACLDADSMVTPNALTAMVGYFNDPKVAAVTPCMKVYKPKTRLQKIQWIEYIYGIMQRKVFACLNIQYVTPGPFSVYRTNIIKKIGGFDGSTPTEDLEIALRLQENGYKIENSLNAEVFTIAPPTLKGVYEQRVRWYRGMIKNVLKYKHLLFSKKHELFGVFGWPLTIILVIAGLVGLILGIWLFGEYLRAWLHTIWLWAKLGYLPTNLNPMLVVLSQNNLLTPISIIMLTSWLVVLWLSHRLAKEKIRLLSRGWKTTYLIYFVAYPIYTSFIWGVAIMLELTKKDIRWKYQVVS